jgi:hypothetical protein
VAQLLCSFSTDGTLSISVRLNKQKTEKQSNQEPLHNRGFWANLHTMSAIKTIIDTSIAALAGVTPENLTPAQLDSSMAILQSSKVNDAIDTYWDSLPEKPENENDVPAWENENHRRAMEINHNLRLFNEELNRIKIMQSALNIPQLDTLIHAAQEVIRPLYDFSAQLSD